MNNPEEFEKEIDELNENISRWAHRAASHQAKIDKLHKRLEWQLEKSFEQKEKIDRLTKTLKYVIRHKNTPPQLAGNILEECVTVCERAISDL